MNYYNDHDKGAAAWLRELIKRGHIPYGYVDERSITDVRPSDLEGFTQCHFFAGIGGWSYALNLARIRPEQRLWTGSPPCQPFSVAGKQLGQLDDRHLAPTFMRLVEQCRPPVLFGEQVAAAIGKHWLDDLFTELERQGYACGSAVLPACSVGAPHKRDRLFFGAQRLGDPNLCKHHTQHYRAMGKSQSTLQRKTWKGYGETATDSGSYDSVADTCSGRLDGKWKPNCGSEQNVGEESESVSIERFCKNGGMADSEQRNRCGDIRSSRRDESANSNHHSSMADTDNSGLERRTGVQERTSEQSTGSGSLDSRSADTHHSFWSGADWLGCRDGKFRSVRSGTFPLVDGLSKTLADLRTIEIRVITEIESYASTCKADTGQMLSVLRDYLQQEARREAERPRMLLELHASKILLDFLLCIISARESSTESGSKPKENDAKCWEFLRMLRLHGEFSGTPYRWESYEPTGGKPSDPLFALSLILARNVAAYWEKAIEAHAAAGRVAMLRGAGNAIVPQVAAEFIKAFMESI